MGTDEFIKTYREIFGATAQLPLAFEFSDKPLCTPRKRLRCIMGAYSLARKGYDVTLDDDFLTCGGGNMYMGRGAMCERIANFVAEVEHYKQSPELVRDYVDNLGIVTAQKRYFNLTRIDRLASWENIEGLIFLATPDIVSGLCAWAFFDRNDADTVCCRFGSACASTVAMATSENRKADGFRCFLGLTDLSARIMLPANELTFVIPSCRLHQMLATLKQCALTNGEAWKKIRNRMTGEKQQ